jgi:hypothetical protein
VDSVFYAVRSFILGDAAIAALIGTRFYPIKAPQNATYPLVTMQKIVEVRYPHLRGSGGMSAPRYQIDAWTRESGAAFTAAQTLAEAIRQRIDGVHRVLSGPGSPATAYRVKFAFDDQRDLFESDTSGGYYRTSTDYVIWHRPV